MLDERKVSMIDLRMKGKGNVEIAKVLGVSRTSIYNWLQEDEVKAELARCVQEIKTHSQNRFNVDIDVMIDNARDLALNSESDKIKSDMTQYWIDRTLGKTTTRLEVDDGRDEKDKVDVDVLNDEIDEFDKE